MNAIVRFYRKIDRLQQTMALKVAASVAGAVAIAIALFPLLSATPPEWTPNFLTQSHAGALWTAALILAWWLLAVWLNLSLTFLLIGLGTAVAASSLWTLGAVQLALAVAGMATLAFTFLLLIRAVLLLFQYPSQVLAVAHTVVKESVRLRISVVFIVVLLILLPLIPSVVDADAALRYRIQSFISWSTGATFYIAACMTIFLACATVAFEIRDRQIWQLMTKPLSRINYLLGKWLGIISVNLVILIVAGVSIFIFVQFLRDQRPDNEIDARAIENEVLVARVGQYPRYEKIPADQMTEIVNREIEQDFQLRQAIENRVKNELAERARIARETQEAFLRNQRSIPPGEMKDFTFEGLEPARRLGLPLRLRYLPHYGGEDTHERIPLIFVFRKNGLIYSGDRFVNPRFVPDAVPTMSHFMQIPADVIGDRDEYAGTLTVSIANGVFNQELDLVPTPGIDRPVNFDLEDLEVLYTVGGFEANYFRAMLVMWVKLAFLAMLGIAAATMLSFPVACLVTFVVFLAAIIGPFLAESLEQFNIVSAWRLDRIVIKGIALAMVFLFEPFGDFKPTQLLVEGRLIAWAQVLKAFALIGVVWTGLALGAGFLAFRDRELATYSGHG